MTSQSERPAAAEVVHLNIRIDLTDRAVDTALLAARLTTALGAVAEVDVTTARRPPASGHSLRLVPRPLLHIESGARRAILRGEPLPLTRLEFDLLHFLRAHPERVFSRAALKAALWPRPDGGGDRTVDVHVRRLRAKLQPHLDPITTVRGVGYRFDGGGLVTLG